MQVTFYCIYTKVPPPHRSAPFFARKTLGASFRRSTFFVKFPCTRNYVFLLQRQLLCIVQLKFFFCKFFNHKKRNNRFSVRQFKYHRCLAKYNVFCSAFFRLTRSLSAYFDRWVMTIFLILSTNISFSNEVFITNNF